MTRINQIHPIMNAALEACIPTWDEFDQREKARQRLTRVSELLRALGTLHRMVALRANEYAAGRIDANEMAADFHIIIPLRIDVEQEILDIAGMY